MSAEITPFTLAVPQRELDDLKARLAAARWPERETVDDWSQGAPLARVQALVAHWRERYDWRRCEAMLNGIGQFKTELDGLGIHFLHKRSPHANALPLILTHGWPGSVIEFHKVIAPLTDPTAYGGEAADAFHVVIPSLPGYGFSDKPAASGWKVERIARAWIALMDRLGYRSWGAQGGDWGAAVTTAIGAIAPEGCLGIHLNMAIVRPPKDALEEATETEKAALEDMARQRRWGRGYSMQQATRPQTLAYALTDSPMGQAAWIYEKFHEWTDCGGDPESVLSRDEMLDNIMLYWLPAAGGSAARLYWESFADFRPLELNLPVGVSIFPREITRPSRRWAERVYKNLAYWNEVSRGGHFAAFEQPDLFVREIRACFRALRPK